MKTEAPKPTILVRLYGGHALPENVTVQTLAELTQAVQSLSKSKLHLMQVRRTSAAYAFSPTNNAVAMEMLKLCAKAIVEPENYLQSRMLSAFDRLTEIAIHLKCKIEMRSLVDSWRWKFGADEWHGIRERSLMKDEGTLTGMLVRVGGSTEKKCGLHVPQSDRMAICTLRDEALARRLGEHLYEEVTLRGIGHFFVRDFKMLSFRVDDFSVVKRGSFEELNRAIRAAGGGWDKVVDPIAEIEGMR